MTGDVTSEIAEDDWERGCWAPRLLFLRAQGEGPAFVQKIEQLKKKKQKEKQKETHEKTETGKEKKFLILFLLQFSATNQREEQ